MTSLRERAQKAAEATRPDFYDYDPDDCANAAMDVVAPYLSRALAALQIHAVRHVGGNYGGAQCALCREWVEQIGVADRHKPDCLITELREALG